MSTLRASRLVAVLLLLTLWPTLGLAQSAPPAGVVTGLQGRATVARPVIPQPILLKFKDDLFLRDQVETKENSLVRVLLGGKALVTIRELSTFWIIEEPGRAAVELKSGKIAVGVAKSLLKPGEAIEIHTPNAIAAVRGSLLVATVGISGGVQQSFFTALDASLPITVTPLACAGVSASLPACVGATVSLQANQAVGVSGVGANAVVGPVQNITPDVARREAQTASAPRAADGPGAASPMAGEISAARFQEATALASLIAPPSTGATAPPADSTLASATQTQLLQESSSTLNTTTQTVVASTPPPPSTGDLGVNATSTTEAVASNDSSTPDSNNNNNPPPPPPPPPPVIGPIVISNQTLVLGANETVKTFSGLSSSTETAPWVTVTNSTVTGAGSLIVAEPGSDTSLAGPLLDVTDSTISTGGRLLHFSGGTLTSGTSSPFLFLDPTSVTSAQQILLFDQGFSLSLSGPLFAASSATIKVGDPTGGVAASFMNVFDGASVNSTSTAPLLSFDGSSVDTAGALLSIRRSTSVSSPSRLTLAGPFFSATNGSSFNTTSLAFGPTFGVGGRSCCTVFFVGQGAQVASTASAPLIQLSGSSINAGPDLQSGGSIVNVTDTVAGFPAAELVAPASVSLAGPLLRAESSSTISALNHLLSLGRASLTSTSPNALIQLVDSSVSLGGLDPFSNTIVDGRLVNLFGPTTSPTTLTLQGALFSAVNSTLTTTGAMVGVFDGATLTSSTQSPLISISGGSALAAISGTGDNFISVASSLGLAPTMSLAGPLLSAINTTLRNGNGSINAFSFLFIGDSSNVTSTGTAPLLAFDNASVDSAASILSLRRSLSTATPTRLTLAGPLFSAINGSTFNTTSLGLGSACCDGFGVRQAAELTSTTTAPLIQLVGSTFNAGPDGQSGGNVFGVSDNSIDGPVTAPAQVSLAGPLLSASGSQISALFSLLLVGRSSFSSSSPDPLIQLSGTSVALGGLNPFTESAAAGRILTLFSSATVPTSFTLAGPLFESTNSVITSTDTMFGVFDSTTFSSTTTSPLISFTGGSATAGAGALPGLFGNMMSVASGQGLSPTVNLAGSLFSATSSVLKTGDPTQNTATFLFVGDSASLTSTGTAPLLVFDNTSIDTAGNVLTLRRSLSAGNPTKLTLAGPLFSAINGSTFNTTSLGLGTACCNGFFIGQNAQLTSTGVEALVQLVNSTFNAGPDLQSGGSFFGIHDTSGCCSNELVAPSKVTLTGSLLSATNSNISALFNLLTVTRSDLSSASSGALIQLSGATVSLGGLDTLGNVQTGGRLLSLVSSASNGTVGSPASVSLSGAGPLLVASNSNVSASSDLIGIFNGATFASSATVPLAQLNGGMVATQSTGGFGGYLLQMGGTGGPTGSGFASAQLGGALLSTTGALNLSGGLVNVFSGGQVTTTGSTNPFVFIDGGIHTIAGNPAPGFAMFGLSGRSTATALDAESGLLLGTDRPIQGALQLDGTRPILTPLLETSGATVTGQKALRMDSALLEATAPLLNLRANGATQSVLTTTGTNAVDLSFQARVSALGSSLIRLDNSVLNVMNGSLVNVNASKLSVTGDLVNLLNGATLSLLNGPLITVAGSGFANITGGLINFGGTGGNTVNVTNNLCPCSLFGGVGGVGGVPVALQNGALATNVQISSPIKNPTLGTVNLSPNAALAVVNGAGSKLIVGPQ